MFWAEGQSELPSFCEDVALQVDSHSSLSVRVRLNVTALLVSRNTRRDC